MNPNTSSLLMPVTPRPDRVMVRGQGSYLWDDRGMRYLDFVQGWAVNALGHCPAEVRRALSQQAARLLTPSPAFHNVPELELAQRLLALTGLSQIHFCNSGAEANEVAIKIARKWGRLHKANAFEILTTHGAFHGRTLAAMSASGKPGWDELFLPSMPGFRKVPYGDIEAMRAAVSEQTVAIMVEPIQGEAGVVVPKANYLSELRALADRHDLLLMLDEIQTGLGRTGTLFAFEHDGVRPDVLTLGKALGSGVPLSAVLANTRSSCLAFGDQGGTYNGNPLITAVGVAVVAALTDGDLLLNVRARSSQLLQGLSELAREYTGSARGRGLLLALALERPSAERVRDVCFERGLLINAARPNILRFMPSLRVSKSEIDEMLKILASALATVFAG